MFWLRKKRKTKSGAEGDRKGLEENRQLFIIGGTVNHNKPGSPRQGGAGGKDRLLPIRRSVR